MCIGQLVLIGLLAATGGVASTYFPYYSLPILVLIFSGRIDQVGILAGAAMCAVVGLGLRGPVGTPDDVTRDLIVVRLLQVLAIAGFAAVAARTIGETRREVAARAAQLVRERAATAAAAVIDELTGLYNRRVLGDRLDGLMADARRHDRPFSVVAVDVNGMKAVNDEAGHEAGDRLLEGLAATFRAQLRAPDVAIRMGGDEFLVLLPETRLPEAQAVAGRVSAAAIEVAARPISVSIGVVEWAPGTDAAELLRQADSEMYRQKRLLAQAGAQPTDTARESKR